MTDPVARGLAITALVVSALTLILNFASYRRSGVRVKVRLRLDRHAYNPMLHTLRVTATNTGSVPVIVTGMGVKQVSDVGGLSLDAEPPGDSGFPVTLEPATSIVARIGMKDVVARWAPGLRLQLMAWVTTKDGRRRTSTGTKTVDTPRHTADEVGEGS